MIVNEIVVNELPENCARCQFSNTLVRFYCNVQFTELKNKYYDTRPKWCPLVVKGVCVWVREKTDRGYAAFYIPKDHEQHRDCYTQDDGTFTFCPSCGRRIVYKESE